MGSSILGFFTAVLLFLNLLILPTLVSLVGICALPFKKTQLFVHFDRLIQLLTHCWMGLNNAIISIPMHNRFDIEMPKLNPKTWYFIISNHQTWADILVLCRVFNARIPVIKFFLKKELLWGLPIAGLACKFAGYPMLERLTPSKLKKNPQLRGRDLEITQQACTRFKTLPSTMMNFLEGTRFSPAKNEKQNSPYPHLLKPQSAGFATVVTEMQGYLSGILDVSIAYERLDANGKPTFTQNHISLWDMLCGRILKIHVHCDVLPVTPDLAGNFAEDREYRKHLQQFLNERWQKKEAWISQKENDVKPSMRER